jgi:hypothetical protein
VQLIAAGRQTGKPANRQASKQQTSKQTSGLSKRKPTIKQMSKQAECVAAKDF